LKKNAVVSTATKKLQTLIFFFQTPLKSSAVINGIKNNNDAKNASCRHKKPKTATTLASHADERKFALTDSKSEPSPNTEH
jgi:hypothetical protein